MKKIMSLVLALCLVCLSVTALAEENDVTGDWYGSMFGMAAQLTMNEDGTYMMKIHGNRTPMVIVMEKQ